MRIPVLNTVRLIVGTVAFLSAGWVFAGADNTSSCC